MYCNYSISAGPWYHLVFTTSSSGGTLAYVNGQLVCSSPYFRTTCTGGGASLAIGVCVADGKIPYTDQYVGYINGTIDDVRIYDRVLSGAEVQELFDSPTDTDSDTWGRIKTLHR